jgi:hypothetical protein
MAEWKSLIYYFTVLSVKIPIAFVPARFLIKLDCNVFVGVENTSLFLSPALRFVLKELHYLVSY